MTNGDIFFPSLRAQAKQSISRLDKCGFAPSRSLSSGAHSRDPLGPRNDELDPTDLPAMANQIWQFGLRQINPTGKSLLIFRNGVKPRLQKYFCFLPTQISSLIRTSRSDRGALRNVINVERDAVDAGSARDERGLLAYGEVVWF